MNWDFLPYVGGTLFTICFSPQVIKIWKTKKVDDLSGGMWILLTMAYICNLTYFIINWNFAMIFNYATGLLMSLIILLLYFKYR
jgi:MtN3 and saliva related transmembrane protein